MGHLLSDSEQMQNITELGEFRKYWRASPEYPEENYCNDHVRYPVNVIYIWKNGRSKITFHTEFCAFIGAGPDEGMVDLDETSKVSVDTFHLRFRPAFQKYSYDRFDHSLVISDTSQKMGGRYEVRITPNIEEP
jgi:hypothetical protein